MDITGLIELNLPRGARPAIKKYTKTTIRCDHSSQVAKETPHRGDVSRKLGKRTAGYGFQLKSISKLPSLRKVGVII